MLTTVYSKHKAVWQPDFNDWDRDYNGSKEKAQIHINDNLSFPFILSVYSYLHAYMYVPSCYFVQH